MVAGREARMPEAELDEEMIGRMRELIGIELRIDDCVHNEEVTRLAVERFADAVGDSNPLWRDLAVAEASVYKQRIAPPSFVMGCFSGLQFGWPGLGSFHTSSSLRFHHPILVGDTIKSVCRYDGFDGPRPSSFASTTVTDRFHNKYRNQHGVLVAEIEWRVMNFSRRKAREGDTQANLQVPHPWTPEEVAAVEESVLAEVPRGKDPRWWDDVHVGDELDIITKGPISMTDEVAYVAAGGPPIPRIAANGASLRQYQRHPAWAFRDPHTMALEPIYAVHYSRAAANAMGVAMQYDVGFQRQCWQVHLLTHWMGDEAWIREASAEYRKFVFHGDVIRLGGEVVSRYIADDGEACVELRTFAMNQRGDDVMPGRATIALPKRGEESPAERRLTATDTKRSSSTSDTGTKARLDGHS